MLWVPQKGRLLCEHNTGSVGDITPGTAVTTSGTAGTKGSPAEIFAATAFDAYLMRIMVLNYGLSATASQAMLDILIGSATEEVLIPNLLVGASRGENVTAAIPSGLGRTYSFPLYIPAGSRIAAQAAGARVSTVMEVAIWLYGGDGIPPFRVAQKVVSYPTSPSVPRGQAITPGASGAEGSWTEVVASTSEDHWGVLPTFQSETDTTMSERAYSLDIAIGASTAEEEIANGYLFGAGTGEFMDGPFPDFPTLVDIPSGNRLSARASSSGTLDTAYGVMLHCLS